MSTGLPSPRSEDLSHVRYQLRHDEQTGRTGMYFLNSAALRDLYLAEPLKNTKNFAKVDFGNTGAIQSLPWR